MTEEYDALAMVAIHDYDADDWTEEDEKFYQAIMDGYNLPANPEGWFKRLWVRTIREEEARLAKSGHAQQ